MKLMTVPHALIQHQWCPNQNKTCKHYVNISLGTILHHDSESELSADNFFIHHMYVQLYVLKCKIVLNSANEIRINEFLCDLKEFVYIMKKIWH